MIKSYLKFSLWLNKVMVVVIIATMIYKAYLRNKAPLYSPPLKPSKKPKQAQIVVSVKYHEQRTSVAEQARTVAGTIAAMSLEDSIRRGNVVTIPSIGLVLTYRNLKDPEGVTPPTRARVVLALQECLLAQTRELERTTDLEKRATIQRNIESLEKDLKDPRRYFLPVDQIDMIG